MRGVRLALAFGLLVGLAGLAGCKRNAPPPSSPAEPLGPPPVLELAGCAEYHRGSRCHASAGDRLTLWIADTPADAAIRLVWSGQEPSETPPVQPVDGGVRLSVRVPASPSALSVSLPQRQAAVVSVAAVPADRAVDEARALRDSGQLEEAAQRLRTAAEGVPAEGASAVAARARALAELGRVERRLGQFESAVAHLAESATTHAEAGNLTGAVYDSIARAYTLSTALRRLPDAAATLDRAAADVGDFAEGRALLAYHRALLARELTRWDQALELLDEAETRARRLDMRDQQLNVAQMRALLWQQFGRGGEALEAFDAAEPLLSDEACERATFFTNRGWSRLLLAEQGDRSQTEPARADFERALAGFVGECGSVSHARNARLNLALVAMAADDVGAAEAYLRSMAAPDSGDAGEGVEPEVRFWTAELGARVARSQGDWAHADASYRELVERGRAASMPDLEWRATTGLGAIRLTRGDVDGAIAALESAERLLFELSLLVPLGVGRGTFLGAREESARLLIDAYLLQNRPAMALRTARRSRSRALASLRALERVRALDPDRRRRWEQVVREYRAAREALDADAERDWTLAASELEAIRQARQQRAVELRRTLNEAYALLDTPDLDTADYRAPAEGERLLVVHPTGPSGSGSWVVFLARPDGVSWHRTSTSAAAPPEELAVALFPGGEEALAGASVLNVAAYGAWRGVDIHALPHRGGVLQEAVAVRYVLDLPTAPSTHERAPAEAESGSAGKHVTVISDPRGDLPSARQEAALVMGRIGASYDVKHLRGAQASPSAVRQALESADYVHFAGHGVATGALGWDSHLVLAGGKLSVGDVLALRRSPKGIVLAGCETGRAPDEARPDMPGIAQAFVASGAQFAVATTRPVADATARDLAAGLYAADHNVLESDPARALRDATEALRAGGASDWAAFRLYSP